jgi:hypothetical protein
MQNAEHIEIAIRAAVIAKSVLELLEDHGIHATRLRLAMAAKQFNELNALLAKIEARANAEAHGRAVARTVQPLVGREIEQ